MEIQAFRRRATGWLINNCGKHLSSQTELDPQTLPQDLDDDKGVEDYLNEKRKWELLVDEYRDITGADSQTPTSITLIRGKGWCIVEVSFGNGEYTSTFAAKDGHKLLHLKLMAP